MKSALSPKPASALGARFQQRGARAVAEHDEMAREAALRARSAVERDELQRFVELRAGGDFNHDAARREGRVEVEQRNRPRPAQRLLQRRLVSARARGRVRPGSRGQIVRQFGNEKTVDRDDSSAGRDGASFSRARARAVGVRARAPAAGPRAISRADRCNATPSLRRDGRPARAKRSNAAWRCGRRPAPARSESRKSCSACVGFCKSAPITPPRRRNRHSRSFRARAPVPPRRF